MTTKNVLALASYFKGQRFLQRAHELGANVYLLTVQKVLGKAWPRQHLKEVFAVPDGTALGDVVKTVSYLARGIRFDEIVALDDFDVETAAHLREHFRLGGMGDSKARLFRDKLAMRTAAAAASIPVPAFTGLFHDDVVREFAARVPAPWMLKPRAQASATGIKKIERGEDLFPALDALGDERSQYLLEAYVAADVYHVDALTHRGKVVFAEVNRCGTPPFDVAHGGGIFSSATVARGSEEERALRAMNERILTSFGHEMGPSHIEFLRDRKTGEFRFLECAARVGGAHIADMVEGATGVNLWSEWAALLLNGDSYTLPKVRTDYGGLVVCLAKDERPDTSSFADPEIVYRSPEAFHVGLAVASPREERVKTLLDEYKARLAREVLAVMPAPKRPSH